MGSSCGTALACGGLVGEAGPQGDGIAASALLMLSTGLWWWFALLQLEASGGALLLAWWPPCGTLVGPTVVVVLGGVPVQEGKNEVDGGLGGEKGTG